IIKYDWQNRVDETKDFEIFRSIKSSTRQNVGAYLERLFRISQIFNFYLHPNVENFSKLKLVDNQNDKNHIIKFALTLRILNVKEFLRLIIAVDTLKELISIRDYNKMLKNIQNFQVRAKIAGVATNQIN